MSELSPQSIADVARGSTPLARDDLDALLASTVEGITVRTPDGRIVYANATAARLLGLDSPQDVIASDMGEHRRRFEIFDAAGRPLDARALPGERARTDGEESELLVRFRPAGGGDESIAVTRSVRLENEHGDLRYVVSYFRPVTEEAAAQTMRRLEHVTKAALSHFSLGELVPSLLESLRTAFEADTAAILLLDEPGEHLVMRFTAGFHDAEVSRARPVPLGKGLAGRVAASRRATLVDDLDELDLVSPVLRARGVASLIAAPLLVEAGRVVGVVHVGSLERGHFGSADAQLLGLMADRIALALNHAALLEAERAAQERLAFLGEASALLAASLDYDDTLARIARLSVPRLADWCAVDMLTESGGIRRLATSHVDPEKVRWAWELSERYPVDPNDAGGVPLVLRTGEPQLVPEVTPEMIDAATADHLDLREALDEVGLRSVMIVPIAARGRTLGAISFCWAESDRRYDEADLEFALDLARRAAIAIDNAQLYREAEERAQAARVLASVGDGVVLVDTVGVVRYWNRAAETITGLARAAVVERQVDDAIPGWQALAERVPVAFEPSAPPRAVSLPLAIAGRELWLSVSGVAVVDGTVYAFRDLTEERALDALKTEFVSTVSHELRTPLAAIYGAAMTLRRDDVVLDAEQSETLLGVITNEADRLARTVNAILWASRLDTAALVTTIEHCDPRVLADEVVAAQRVHLPAHVSIDLEAPPGLPDVAADPDKVRQVLVNLVDNAVKYSPDGGTVRVQVTPGGHRVRFSVTDEGLGIPYAEQRRIFDKFYRLDPQMTRGIGGTGLGLYICRELVRRMEGEIWVISEPGRGSTFTFELPLAA